MVDMKNFIVIVFLGLFTAVLAHAQYVRKLKEPDFFIPAGSEMHKKEVLPEIKIIPKKTEKSETIQEDGLTVKNESIKKTENINIDASLKDKKETPEYKKKYNQYIDDIMRFYSDGTMPKNDQLLKDLEAMNSDEKKTVVAPAPAKLTSEEMERFYVLYQEMLNN